MAWDIIETLGLVEDRHGAAQKKLVEPTLNSVTRKFEIARYHSFESKKLIDKYFGNDAFDNYDKSLRFIFDSINKDEEAMNFYRDAFVSEANIMAYAHTVNSIFDIMGQAIIDSLNIRSLFKSNIYLFTVLEKLKEKHIAGGVETAVENVINCDQFKYLRAFVNKNKHVSLIKIGHVVTFGEDAGHGIQIAAFNGYHTRWAKEFVAEDFQALLEGIIEIGNSINDYLR